MKRLICILLTAVLLCASLASCSIDETGEGDENTPRVTPTMDQIDFSAISDLSGVTESETPTDYVKIEVQDYGTIVIRLFPDVAPKTVENFKNLVSQKFYDGIIFHRVIENFMIQGGDPDGDGTGGSPNKIQGEFNANGFQNNLLHRRGVVSMARANDKNSASSQFFIMHKDYPSLNGQYASFGYVIYGMDTVDDIASVLTDSNDKPVFDVKMTSVRFVTVAQ